MHNVVVLNIFSIDRRVPEYKATELTFLNNDARGSPQQWGKMPQYILNGRKSWNRLYYDGHVPGECCDRYNVFDFIEEFQASRPHVKRILDCSARVYERKGDWFRFPLLSESEKVSAPSVSYQGSHAFTIHSMLINGPVNSLTNIRIHKKTKIACPGVYSTAFKRWTTCRTRKPIVPQFGPNSSVPTLLHINSAAVAGGLALCPALFGCFVPRCCCLQPCLFPGVVRLLCDALLLFAALLCARHCLVALCCAAVAGGLGQS